MRRQLTEVQTNLEFENQKIKAQLESATNNLQAQNGEVEKLKADNQMEWVGRMSNLRSAVTETVNAEVIFV